MGQNKSKQHHLVSSNEHCLICDVCQKEKPVFHEIDDQHLCQECYRLLIIKQQLDDKKHFEKRINTYQDSSPKKK